MKSTFCVCVPTGIFFIPVVLVLVAMSAAQDLNSQIPARASEAEIGSHPNVQVRLLQPAPLLPPDYACYRINLERRAPVLDRTTRLLIGVDLAATAADGVLTAIDQSFPGYVHTKVIGYNARGPVAIRLRPQRTGEIDPLARLFVQSTAGQVGFFAGKAALDTLAVYELRKHGHLRAARILQFVEIGMSIDGAAMSGAHLATSRRAAVAWKVRR